MKFAVATGDFNTAEYEDGTKILGGSGWIRFGQYVQYSELDPLIGELIWKEQSGEFGVRDWKGTEHFGIDVLLMQRWMHDTIPARMKTAQGNGQIILNDVDDWYWGLNPGNQAFHDSHPKVSPRENIIHYRKAVAQSDGVVTSTPYLAERLSSFVRKDKLVVLPNHIEIDKFRPHVHTEADKPVIGWLGSTAHRSGDLSILKGVYSQTKDRYGYHHSAHVGWFPPFYEVVGLGIDDVTILPPAPSEKLGQLMRFDIGVVPLTSNSFNEAKSWIKGLEYAAAGIPFVASGSSEYKRLKSVYGVGRIAFKQPEWVKHLEQLRDPAFRQEEADANLAAIAPLDAPNGAKIWDDIIRSFA